MIRVLGLNTMRFSLLLTIAGFSLSALAQKLPLSTSSRWILDSTGARVKLRAINWAGHGEANIPEGLHKQSIDHIADFIKANNFNAVRLTYSIDHALDPNKKVSDSFIAAAAASGIDVATMTNMYNNVVTKNPFIAGASNQDVFAAVIKALWNRGIMTVLDNHVSKASWCCNIDDGNGWWDEAFGYNDLNSRYFKTQNWLNGLTAQATWARSQPGVIGLSLRNEIRPFLLQDTNNHDDWYNFMHQGGVRVHDAFPEALVIVGGSQSATDLSFLKSRDFEVSWPGKHVWEMHAYSFTLTFPDPFNSCDWVKAEYGFFDGFVLTQGKSYTAPLILSEFGVGLQGGPNDGLSDDDKSYLDCLYGYMKSNDMDWALWAIQGTYYVRQGQANYDESWGLMDRDWNGARNPTFLGKYPDIFKQTQGP
ncbi:glycoside hydrolase superfamily [Bisporella sp. PMI_857]|nr:glycoside hydrolase superfamily [Bisporella sp. PMI_857]